MYLTKAALRRDSGPKGSYAAQLLDAAGRDNAHRLVWALFSETGGEQRDFLFREVEPGEYIVLSKREPTDATGLWSLQTRPFEPEFQIGQKLGFLLRANPAETAKLAGVKNGRAKRVDAVMNAKRPRAERGNATFDAQEVEEAALNWLVKRQNRLGVVFDTARCAVSAYDVLRVPRGRSGEDMRFGVADYEGVMQVQDPAALLTAVCGGIGKAKAFGCGLMLVRPV